MNFLAPYKLYLQAAGAVILIGLFFWYRHSLIAMGEQNVRDAIEVQRAKDVLESEAKEQARRDQLNKVSADYEAKLTDLRRAQAAAVPSVVRVCNNRPVNLPAPTTIASGPGSPSAAGLDPADGPDNSVDIGPQLDRYKFDAQALAMRCQKVIDAWPK